MKFRVSARPRNILYLFLEQLKSDLKISRSSPVSFREIVETSRKVTNLHAQSRPETSASFHNYFSYPKLLWVAVTQSANPSIVSSDLTGHTGESVQTPGKPK